MRKARLVPLCVFNAVLLNQELTASASISSKYDFIHRGLHENKRMYAWSMLFLISSAPTAVPRKYKAFTRKAGITKQFVEAHLALPRRICYESLGQKRFPWLLKSEMLQVCFSHLTWEKIRREKKSRKNEEKGRRERWQVWVSTTFAVWPGRLYPFWGSLWRPKRYEWRGEIHPILAGTRR